MKVCTQCRRDLDLGAFQKRSKSPDGLAYKCAECVNGNRRLAYEQSEEVRALAKSRAATWAAANPARRAEIAQAHTERVRVSGKQRRKELDDRRRDANPAAFRLRWRLAAQRRRHRMYGSNSWIHPGLAKRILAAANGRCLYCLEPTDSLTLDHFHPVSAGGGGQARNLIPCCGSCNSSKKDRDGPTWLERKFGTQRLVELIHRISDIEYARLP